MDFSIPVRVCRFSSCNTIDFPHFKIICLWSKVTFIINLPTATYHFIVIFSLNNSERDFVVCKIRSRMVRVQGAYADHSTHMKGITIVTYIIILLFKTLTSRRRQFTLPTEVDFRKFLQLERRLLFFPR